MKKGVVLLSGGLDSSTLLHYVKKELGFDHIYALSFNYGQRHSIELEMSCIQAKSVGVQDHTLIDISFFGELTKDVSALTGDIKVPHIRDVLGDPQPVTYVPYRNLMMLSITLAHAENVGCEVVFYGAQKADTYSGYWDASPEFLEAVNKVSLLNRRHKIIVEAPFMNMSKSDIIVWGYGNGVDYSKTWTSYQPIMKNGEYYADGTTPTDADRIQAFAKAGIKDPMKYINEPDWSKLLSKGV